MMFLMEDTGSVFVFTYLTTHTGTTSLIEPLFILTEYIPEERVEILIGNW
jgi:hypothetical protein